MVTEMNSNMRREDEIWRIWKCNETKEWKNDGNIKCDELGTRVQEAWDGRVSEGPAVILIPVYWFAVVKKIYVTGF